MRFWVLVSKEIITIPPKRLPWPHIDFLSTNVLFWWWGVASWNVRFWNPSAQLLCLECSSGCALWIHSHLVMLHYYHVIVIIFLYGLIGIFVKMLNYPLNTVKHQHPLEITHWFLDSIIAIINLSKWTVWTWHHLCIFISIFNFSRRCKAAE